MSTSVLWGLLCLSGVKWNLLFSFLTWWGQRALCSVSLTAPQDSQAPIVRHRTHTPAWPHAWGGHWYGPWASSWFSLGWMRVCVSVSLVPIALIVVTLALIPDKHRNSVSSKGSILWKMLYPINTFVMAYVIAETSVKGTLKHIVLFWPASLCLGLS